MNRNQNFSPEDEQEFADEEFLEKDRGRKIECTCDEDPKWCEKHNNF